MNKRWVGAHAAGAPLSAVCIKPASNHFDAHLVHRTRGGSDCAAFGMSDLSGQFTDEVMNHRALQGIYP